MNEFTSELLIDCRNGLGEGIQWNAEHGRVYWTDILGNVLLSCDETGRDFRNVPLEAGLCAFAFTKTDRVLAGFADALCWLDIESGEREIILPYQPDRPGSRLNDGTVDRHGRFVIGGLDSDQSDPQATVWSVTGDGDGAGAREIISGVGVANSTAFSPDGKTMYFADTRFKDIRAYDYDPETGTPSNRRVFATLGPDEGGPDGSTVDAEGALWNAEWGGWAVQRWTADGRRDARVAVPVPNVTCCALGGKDLNRLFITSARQGMTEAQLEQTPTAGGLFVVDVPFTGIATGKYAG